MDSENEIKSNGADCGCGCGCSGQHGSEEECCGGRDDCGCGCEHDHENQYLTLVLEDDSELRCRVIGTFESDGRSYIALLHPTDGTAFLFRYTSHEDRSIDIEEIEDDAEYEKVSSLFMSLYGC